MEEKSLIILKPDCVRRWLIWKVTQRYEELWFRLVAAKVTSLTQEVLEDHYSHLTDKPFFGDIVEYMTENPVMIQIREWINCIETIRKYNGATDPAEAQPWTIRGDYASHVRENIVHASEDADAAQEEITRFFSSDEIASY